MNEAEMKVVLEETLRDQSRNASFRKNRGPDAKLHPSVPAGDLARLEDHWRTIGLQLPPSFRQFLKISNGIQDYMQLEQLSLRSAAEIVGSYESDDQWNEYDPLHKFVFASGETMEFIAFDCRKVDGAGEASVVWVDLRGGETEYLNFEDLLWSQQRFQMDVLKAKVADRKVPSDD